MSRTSPENRRQQITSAALDVFLEKGYKTASMQDVAASLGITKAAIYHYFKTKEEILYFILVETNRKNLETLRSTDFSFNRENTTPMETLQQIIHSYAWISLENSRVALLSMRERHQLTGKFQDNYQKIEREIFTLLKKRISTVPGIKDHLNMNTIAFMVISMVAWFGYWFREDGRMSREEVIEQGVEIICSGFIENKKA